MSDYITCPNCGQHHDTTACPRPYMFGEPKEDEVTKKLQEGLHESVKEYCEKSATLIAGVINAEFAKKDATIAALQSRIAELTMPDDVRETIEWAINNSVDDASGSLYDKCFDALDWLQKGAK